MRLLKESFHMLSLILIHRGGSMPRSKDDLVVVHDATRQARLPRSDLLAEIPGELFPTGDDPCQSHAVRRSKTWPCRSQPISTDALLSNCKKGKPTTTLDLSTEEAFPPLSQSLRSARLAEEGERGAGKPETTLKAYLARGGGGNGLWTRPPNCPSCSFGLGTHFQTRVFGRFDFFLAI
jgi:hypothetical protein